MASTYPTERIYMGHYQKMEKSVSYTIFHIRNFNFIVFLSIELNYVMCNMNKTLSNVSGDVVLKLKLKQTPFSRFLQCSNVGSFYHLQLFQKHINTCLVLNWSMTL